MNAALASHCMRRCLDLAMLGRKRVGNGALVGAVLVREGKIIAEGYHHAFGEAHAERQLLQNFDQEIQQNDELFVNLEPCSHTGKTLPCTDIILQRGVKNVTFGLTDPDPRVAGKGIKILEQNGVTVTGPLERALCERVNRGFVMARRKSRPWITVKMAKDRAGSISKPDGSPLKITSKEQDIWSHTFLRSQLDAVLVGVQTIINDNPKLNIRFVQENPSFTQSALIGDRKEKNNKIEQAQPWRIILDPQLRIPEAANVVSDDLRDHTIIITDPKTTSDTAPQKKLLSDRGVLIFDVSREGDDFVWEELWKVLLTPQEGFAGLTSMLVEGGPRTLATFRQNGIVDEDVALLGLI